MVRTISERFFTPIPESPSQVFQPQKKMELESTLSGIRNKVHRYLPLPPRSLFNVFHDFFRFCRWLFGGNVPPDVDQSELAYALELFGIWDQELLQQGKKVPFSTVMRHWICGLESLKEPPENKIAGLKWGKRVQEQIEKCLAESFSKGCEQLEKLDQEIENDLVRMKINHHYYLPLLIDEKQRLLEIVKGEEKFTLRFYPDSDDETTIEMEEETLVSQIKHLLWLQLKTGSEDHWDNFLTLLNRESREVQLQFNIIINRSEALKKYYPYALVNNSPKLEEEFFGACGVMPQWAKDKMSKEFKEAFGKVKQHYYTSLVILDDRLNKQTDTVVRVDLLKELLNNKETFKEQQLIQRVAFFEYFSDKLKNTGDQKWNRLLYYCAKKTQRSLQHHVEATTLVARLKRIMNDLEKRVLPPSVIRNSVTFGSLQFKETVKSIESDSPVLRERELSLMLAPEIEGTQDEQLVQFRNTRIKLQKLFLQNEMWQGENLLREMVHRLEKQVSKGILNSHVNQWSEECKAWSELIFKLYLHHGQMQPSKNQIELLAQLLITSIRLMNVSREKYTLDTTFLSRQLEGIEGSQAILKKIDDLSSKKILLWGTHKQLNQSRAPEEHVRDRELLLENLTIEEIDRFVETPWDPKIAQKIPHEIQSFRKVHLYLSLILTRSQQLVSNLPKDLLWGKKIQVMKSANDYHIIPYCRRFHYNPNRVEPCRLRQMTLMDAQEKMRRSFLHKIDPHADPEDALYVLYARLPDLSDDQVTALIPKSLRKEGMKWNRDGMRLHSDNITLNLIEGRLYVDGVSKVPLKYLISQKSSLLATEREKTYSYESADQAYQIAKETGFLYQRRYDEWYQVVTPSGKHLPFHRIKDQAFLIHPETRAFFHGPYRGQLNGDRIESIEVIEDGHAYPLASPPPLFAAIEEKQWIHCYCEGTQIVKVDYPRLNLSYKWDDKKQRFNCQHPDLDGFYLTATTLSKQLNLPQSHEPEQHYHIVMNHEGVARLLLPKVPYAPAYLKGETPINTRHRPPRMRPQWQGHTPSLGIFTLDDRASLPFKL